MREKKLVTAYANWVIRNRIWVIVASLAVIVFLGGFLGRLSFDSNYRIWFDEEDPYLKSYDLFVKEFGHDDMFVVAFEEPQGILQPKPLETIQRLTDKFWHVAGVIRVDSLSNFQALRGDAEGFSAEALFPSDKPVTPERIAAARSYIDQDPLVTGSLISPDRKVGIIRARIAPVAVTPELPAKVYNQLMQILDEEKARSGYEFYLAGGPITDQAFDQVAQKDMGFLVPLLLVILGVVWFILFRSILGVLLSLGISLLSVIGAMGLTGLVGHKLNVVTTTTPQLLIGIAVAGCVHMAAMFVKAKRKGLNSRDAAKESLRINLSAIVMTSVTTAIGFFSFYLTATIIPLKLFGFEAGCGTLLILFLTLTLLPALLSFFPEKTPRPVFDSEWFKGFLDRLRWASIHRSRQVVLGWLVFIGIFAAFLPMLTVDSNPVSYFRSSFWFAESVHFLEEKGSGGAVYELVVRGKGPDSIKTVEYMRDRDAFTQYLAQEAPGGLSNVYSLSTVLRNVNRALHEDDPSFHTLPDDNDSIAQYLFLYSLSVPVGQDINDRFNVDYSASRVTVIRALVPTRASRENMDIISDWAAKNLKNVKVEFTGRDVLYTNMGNNVSDSLISSFAVSVVGVTVLIGLLFRSWLLGLASTLPNFLPVLVALGFMGMAGIYLDIGTIMVASIGYGIAVDDTIHFFSHYREARRAGHTAREAIGEAFSDVGISITFTTAVLVLAFCVFLFGDFMPNVYKGLLVGLFLVVALAADLSITPAVLSLIDKPRRLLARISHTPPTADADPLAVAHRTPSRRLDVESATPSPPLGPCGTPQRRLDDLATKGCEKSGLAGASESDPGKGGHGHPVPSAADVAGRSEFTALDADYAGTGHPPVAGAGGGTVFTANPAGRMGENSN
ncbi:MAG: efflux RND transporter permease subunit [Methylocaldum sp.]|nr:efflux RND transporter permease subunit [Methylocaldum sp.]